MSSAIPFSLDTLRSHAIFLPPASGSTDDGWVLVDTPAVAADGLPACKNVRLAVRDKDLLVAFGNQVRITSLAGEGFEVNRDNTVGSYKTLRSPHLTFQIHRIVVNPTGRLLAVVGDHQLVILVLPRTGLASASGEVACRSFPVDEYQHSPSSANAITKVLWHPWGESGNSLWALCADGQLFEYDVLHPQDPVQTFNFLPEKSTSVSSKFSAIDPLAQYATSFAFSEGTMDFGPLMVYVLMANGDVYTMGPVLPLHAEVPAVYLASLRAYVCERTKRLKKSDEDAFWGAGHEGSAEHASLVGRVALQSQWVEGVVRQAEDSSPVPRRGFGLRDMPAPPKASRPPPPPGLVRVHPPHLTESGGPAPGIHRPLLRQGPLLFDPSPQEVGNGDETDEQIASDLVIMRALGNGEGPERLNVVGIAWSGGRVDLGADLTSSEPRWVTSRDPAPEDVVLAVVESVLSSFPANVEQQAIEMNAPMFVKDPIHADVVYIEHAFGVDAISVEPWVSKVLGGGEDELPSSEVACLVESSSTRPVVGVVTFCNITLGYGLLALASSGQLAVVEMDFRVQDRGTSAPPPEPEEVKAAEPREEADSQSLLGKPFDLKALQSEISASPAVFNPRAAVRKVAGANKPLATVGPEELRALAEAASQVHARAAAVRKAAGATERRTDLAAAEYQRQLKVLGDAAARTADVRTQAAHNTARIQGMAEEQAALGRRLDAVLTAMMAQYRPQIGQVERKWFDELERIRQRVDGGAAVRTRSALAHRAQVLSEQLDIVRPQAEARLKAEQAGAGGDADAPGATYGAKQLRPLQNALSERSDELARLMRKLETLTVRVDEADASPRRGADDGGESD